MKLYYFPVAPNPTKVRLYLAEKAAGGTEIPLEMERVNLREGEQKTPEFLQKNPFGKLPVLELDDGGCIAESLPIIEFFEELYPDPPMIGTTPEERLRVRSAERIADGVLQRVGRLVHATNSPLGLPPDEHVAHVMRKDIVPGLTELNKRLGESEFVAGDRVSIADCTLFAGLSFGAFFGADLKIDYPNIVRWHTAFAARPTANLPG